MECRSVRRSTCPRRNQHGIPCWHRSWSPSTRNSGALATCRQGCSRCCWPAAPSRRQSSASPNRWLRRPIPSQKAAISSTRAAASPVFCSLMTPEGHWLRRGRKQVLRATRAPRRQLTASVGMYQPRRKSSVTAFDAGLRTCPRRALIPCASTRDPLRSLVEAEGGALGERTPRTAAGNA